MLFKNRYFNAHKFIFETKQKYIIIRELILKNEKSYLVCLKYHLFKLSSTIVIAQILKNAILITK